MALDDAEGAVMNLPHRVQVHTLYQAMLAVGAVAHMNQDQCAGRGTHIRHEGTCTLLHTVQHQKLVCNLHQAQQCFFCMYRTFTECFVIHQLLQTNNVFACRYT